MRKLKHEDYLKKLKEAGSDIIPLQRYNGRFKKIAHYCPKHRRIWKTIPSSVIQGAGCPKCHTERRWKDSKRTDEKYLQDLKAKGISDIVPVESYIDAKTKIKHKCLIHDYIWEATPANILAGRKCPECRRQAAIKANLKSNDQYIADLHAVNPNIQLLGEYTKAKNPTLHRCLKCGYEWMVTPASLLNGTGCPNCSNKVRYTTESFKAKMAAINPDVEIIGEYSNKEIHCRCKICGHEYTTSSSALLSGRKCRNCVIRDRTRTQEQYEKELFEIDPTIEVLGQYTRCDEKILHRCKVCGHEWEVMPTSFLHAKNGCPKCARKRERPELRRTQEEYLQDLKDLGIADVIPIEEYVKANVKIKHKCLKHNFIWEVAPMNVLNGQGCPKCRSSKGENKVQNWLSIHDIDYELQKTFDGLKYKQLLRFDFYLPKFNTCIEYDGEQHFHPVDFSNHHDEDTARETYEKTVIRDKLKDDYCKEHNIRLIRIPYYEDVYSVLDKTLNELQ